MTWENSRFDRAFDRIGVRELVTPIADPLPYPPFMARFDRPQRIMTEEGMHTTDYSIEFTTSDAPTLAYQTRLRIGGVAYRVRDDPVAQGDGYWTIAVLEAWP